MSARNLFSLRGSEDTVFDRRHKEPVLLNVYDLCNLNDFTIALGLGVFHTGIQLYGIEYCFGGHDVPGRSGVFEMNPCNNRGELRYNFRFRKSILLGHTCLSSKEVQRIVDRLGQRQFTGRMYHIVSHNCNHFSIQLSKILCGRPIPAWVNRLANLIAHVPFIVHYLTPPHQRRQHQRRPEKRLEQRSEKRPEKRSEQLPGLRLEQRLGKRPEKRPEQLSKKRPEKRPDQRPEKRPVQRPEQRPKQCTEHRPERRSERRTEYSSEYRPDRHSEYSSEYRSEYRPERRPDYRPEYRLEYRPERHPEYRLERRPDYRSERRPERYL